MRRNGHKTTSDQILNPKFETPIGCFLFDYEFIFGAPNPMIYTCFKRKTAFVMQNFRNLGAIGGGVTIFDETPKRLILGRFHVFGAIMRANSFTRFFARRLDEKRDTTKSKVTYVIFDFHLFAGNSPLNQI